jgi:hypothetical protein
MIAKMPSETLKGFRRHFLSDIILSIFFTGA